MQNWRNISRQSIRSSGFTLLELLAVIATIATLAAMMLPVLAKAKGRAQQANCMSNLRQLGMSWTMYSNDNAGRLAESSAKSPYPWVQGNMRNPLEAEDKALIAAGTLYQYCNRSAAIYHCPSDKGVTVNDRKLSNVRSYAMNVYMGPRYMDLKQPTSSTATFFTKESDLAVANPSQLWVLIDQDDRSIDDGCFVTDSAARIWFELPSISKYRHQLKYSLVFADGSAGAWALNDPKTLSVFKNGAEQQSGNEDLRRLAKASTIDSAVR